MAGTFNPTSAYTNLTRLELEELRRSDHQANLKALTVGDSAYGSENVVGPGNLRAEPYYSGAAVTGEDAPSFMPPTIPGPGLGTVTQVGPGASETVKWFGPLPLVSSEQGYLTNPDFLTDNTVDFLSSGVQDGDLVLVTNISDANYAGTILDRYARGDAYAVTANQLRCNDLKVLGGSPTFTDEGPYTYLIVRPTAVQLFAVPGSGAKGFEQTFMMVQPGSSLHSTLAPTISQISAERITHLVPPQFSNLDRSDVVYNHEGFFPSSAGTVDQLGYRVILYPDDGSGSGPNLQAPISTLSPVIDPAIPLSDQRMTIDYKAGVVRFSCAPKLGGNIKVSGGVNATTGRLNVYAVFWAFDTTLTRGVSRGLWSTRSTEGMLKAPGKVTFRNTPLFSGGPANVWEVTSAPSGPISSNSAWMYAPDPDENWRCPTMFGSSSTYYGTRYLVFNQNSSLPAGVGGKWRFVSSIPQLVDPYWSMEVDVGQKHEITLGDSAGPPRIAGDINPAAYGPSPRSRAVNQELDDVLKAAGKGSYTTVRLGRGNYRLQSYSSTINIPPGVILEGDGDGTVIESFNRNEDSYPRPLFKVGPNTSWGVYDFDLGSPTPTFVLPSGVRIEGVEIVWNPLRQVWGVFVADLTQDAIWFNEVRLDGTSVFSGVGVDIKASAVRLFSTLSNFSESHTTGHYPRAAFDAYLGYYYVTWVEEITVGGRIGPRAYLQGVLVTESTADPLINASSASPTVPVPSITFAFGSKQALNHTYSYSDHPSVAVGTDGIDTLLCVTAWGFEHHATIPVPTASVVLRFYAAAFSPPTTPTFAVIHTHTNFPSLPVISSTDVVYDGDNGWYAAWSVREHPLIVSSTGRFSDSGSFSDPTLIPTTWASYGMYLRGSRFLWLGKDTNLTPNATWDTENDGYTESWGDSGTVTVIGGVNLTVRSDKTGVLFGSTTGGPCYPFPVELAKVPGSATGVWTMGASGLTDASALFNTWGVQAGDFVRISATEWREVASVLGETSLTITGTWLTSSPGTYSIHEGNPFSYAIVPGSFIEVVRCEETTELGVQRVTGTNASQYTSNYDSTQSEPDYVRLCKGDNNVILIWQAMETTAKLATVEAVNIRDNARGTDSDVRLPLNEYRCPYRIYNGTHAVIINRYGDPASTNLRSIDPTKADFDQAISELPDWIYTSLGTRNPMSRRPNWTQYSNANTNPDFETRRNRQRFDMAVCAHNFIHRWEMDSASGVGKVPALIPDVTWSGHDYTVVVPTKTQFRSCVGCYRVDGSGNVDLLDATFYFGDDNYSTENPTNPTFVRSTFPFGSLVYFPTSPFVACNITSIRTPHSVRLNALDSALLGKGDNTETKRVEWILCTYSSTHGLKNLGFRVSETGEVILSSTFNTFSDERTDFENLDGNNPDANPTVIRTAEIDRFTDTHLGNYGCQAPALKGRVYHGIDPYVDYQYNTDIGFRGVAVGAPRMSGRSLVNEAPICAIAWGDTCYGFADRLNHYNTYDYNFVKVFRQTFGPYNCGLRNLKINASYRNNTRVTPTRSKHHVYTRWGAPQGITGSFATDGYRNLFVFAETGASNSSGMGVRAVYTNTVGRWPVSLNGDYFTRVGASTLVVPGEVCKVGGSFSPRGSEWPTYCSAPKVVWDGKRFVVSTTRESTYSSYELQLSYLYGDETRDPNSILMGPDDHLSEYTVARTMISFAGCSMDPYVVAHEIATSGNTYAVAWIAGLSGAPGANDTVVGVTIFDGAEMGSGYFDPSDNPYYYGASYTTAGTLAVRDTLLTDTTGYVFTGPGIDVNTGDILAIRNNTDGGVYRIAWGSSNTINVDRNLPTGSGYYFLFRPSVPATGRNYILSTYGHASYRSLVSGPKILWDGQQYVVTWSAGHPDGTMGSDREFDIRVASVPEYGYGLGAQESNYGIPSAAFTPCGIGALEQGDASATRIYFRNKSAARTTINLSGTSPNTYFTTTVDPRANGIVKGDLIELAATTGGPWVVLAVTGSGSPWTISVHQAVPTTGGAVSANIFDSYLPKVKTGDRIHISQILLDGVAVTDEPKIVTVTKIDYFNRYLEVNEKLATTTTVLTTQVKGYIESGNSSEYVWRNLSVSSEETWPNASAPHARPLIPPSVASNSSTLLIRRVWDVVYNELDDEYVALVQAFTGAPRLYAWRKGVNRVHREVDLTSYVSGSADTSIAALGWNGSEYCVLCHIEVSPYEVMCLSLDRNLRPTAAQAVSIMASNHVSDPYLGLVGSSRYQVPGVGYVYRGVVDGGIYSNRLIEPRIRRLQVKWNDKLNRWLVAVTLPWLDETLTDADDILPEYLASIDFVPTTVGVGTNTEVTWALDPSSYVGKYFVPGLKVVASSMGGVTQVLTVTSSHFQGGVFYAYFGEPLVSSVAANYQYWSFLPREDVFLYTLGFNSPVIQLEDADGVLLENLTLNGAVDVEEKWTHMTMPLWTASGPMTGRGGNTSRASLDNSDTSFMRPKGVYGNRLLTPAGKVKLPQFSNVRSATTYKHGEKKGSGK